MQGEDWDALRVLLALARDGSHSRAAARLGVHETTVARQLRRAETRLGTPLFERQGRRLCPTGSGRRVIALAERIEREITHAEGDVTGAATAIAGTVRITAVPMIANRLLAPALPAIVAQHPDLHIELVAEAADLSLLRREADIALRFARPQGETAARARRVATLGYSVYAAAGRQSDPLPWIGYEPMTAQLPQAKWLARTGADAPASIAVNDAETLIACLLAGLGRSLLPCRIGDHIAGLARLSSPAPDLSRELWMIINPDLARIARVRAVADWLVATTAGR